MDWELAITVVALVWGASVVGDSAQFSIALTELCDEAYRGTALSFQTGLGFLITIIPIRLVPILSDWVGWGPAFSVLGIGLVLGIAAMLRLRSLSESLACALGRR